MNYELIVLLSSIAVTYPFLGSDILNTLFSNTVCLCSSLRVRDCILYTYSTVGKIRILYVLIPCDKHMWKGNMQKDCQTCSYVVIVPEQHEGTYFMCTGISCYCSIIEMNFFLCVMQCASS